MRRFYISSSLIILQNGANIDAQSDDGETALMIAAGRGRAATMRVLLAAGARLDLRSRKGDTALSVATYGEATQLIKDATP
jgi:ankyrin repeat protein